MVRPGFNEKPLREVTATAAAYLTKRAEFLGSRDYTETGRRHAIAREQACAIDALKPFRSKASEAKRAASVRQTKAVAEWRGEVDPAEVREQRSLVRQLDPVDVAGRLVAAVARGDRTFIAAVESSMNTEFPLTTDEAWHRCTEAIAERVLDDATRNATAGADALESVVNDVEREVRGESWQ